MTEITNPAGIGSADFRRAMGRFATGVTVVTSVDSAARTMAASRMVTLRCQPEVAAGFARLGVAGVEGVRLVTADGR
jgi:flavin reductase (DIM6/NTAB) family NADH-FMN oxidoreductase RutF